MKNITALLLLLFLTLPLFGQQRARKEFNLPDILGYKTLKCDFHIHTVFSDGNVWPTVRPEEAWRQGLDVIALTDHIEYTPHDKDINIDFNRPYEIAKPYADNLDILVIRGGEITRGMPPGHFNAIFLNDASKIKTDKWQDAFKAAADQDAFIFWNHPGWEGHQHDHLARWYDEHTWLFEKGWLQGIEVVNTYDYYPEAHQWCIDKNLTMLSNSDTHDPVQMEHAMGIYNYRPMTIVFAENKSEQAVLDALKARRTVVYSQNRLIGDEKFLLPLFENSVEFLSTELELNGRGWANCFVKNNSDVEYKLVRASLNDIVQVQREIILEPGKTTIFGIRAWDRKRSGKQKVKLEYYLENLLVRPDEAMKYNLELTVKFTPSE